MQMGFIRWDNIIRLTEKGWILIDFEEYYLIITILL